MRWKQISESHHLGSELIWPLPLLLSQAPVPCGVWSVRPKCGQEVSYKTFITNIKYRIVAVLTRWINMNRLFWCVQSFICWHWWIIYKDLGAPPYGKKSAVGQKMCEKSSKEELNLATGKSTQFVRAWTPWIFYPGHSNFSSPTSSMILVCFSFLCVFPTTVVFRYVCRICF